MQIRFWAPGTAGTPLAPRLSGNAGKDRLTKVDFVPVAIAGWLAKQRAGGNSLEDGNWHHIHFVFQGTWEKKLLTKVSFVLVQIAGWLNDRKRRSIFYNLRVEIFITRFNFEMQCRSLKKKRKKKKRAFKLRKREKKSYMSYFVAFLLCCYVRPALK